MDLARGIFGIFSLLFLLWLFSKNRKGISLRLILSGLILQFCFALLLLKVPIIKDLVQGISRGVVQLTEFSYIGSTFVFGKLASDANSFGTVVAFRVLPSILFFSALSALLYHWGILQRVVYLLAWLMKRTMRISGPECLAMSANVFVGQTEAPLLIRPYLDKMTKSEILCLMTGGFATIAGGVFAAYVAFLGGANPEDQALFAKHLLTASLMSAPAAIVCAKIILPETEMRNESFDLFKDESSENIFDALTAGTSQGLLLAFNVGAILIVFTGIVALANFVLNDLVFKPLGINILFGLNEAQFSLENLLGLIFSPIAWLIGVDSSDIHLVGQLLGEKLVLNEFVAYSHLGEFKEQARIHSEKSIVLASYALCGFANFASVGIQVAGIAILAPSQRKNLTTLGWRALLAGTVACLLSAGVVNLVI
jgi:concentrative nucleoside transporter, CNT family